MRPCEHALWPLPGPLQGRTPNLPLSQPPAVYFGGQWTFPEALAFSHVQLLASKLAPPFRLWLAPPLFASPTIRGRLCLSGFVCFSLQDAGGGGGAAAATGLSWLCLSLLSTGSLESVPATVYGQHLACVRYRGVLRIIPPNIPDGSVRQAMQIIQRF